MGPAWAEVRAPLEHLSDSCATHGFTASETATFVFSLKQPLACPDAPGARTRCRWARRGHLADHRAPGCAGALHRSVSAESGGHHCPPAARAPGTLHAGGPTWDGVLAVPLIGTLDSAWTQMVMENLLQRIVETRSAIAIVDITGVPLVDTLVAQHLLKPWRRLG